MLSEKSSPISPFDRTDGQPKSLCTIDWGPDNHLSLSVYYMLRHPTRPRHLLRTLHARTQVCGSNQWERSFAMINIILPHIHIKSLWKMLSIRYIVHNTYCSHFMYGTVVKFPYFGFMWARAGRRLKQNQLAEEHCEFYETISSWVAPRVGLRSTEYCRAFTKY